jgi:hypothetical protein
MLATLRDTRHSYGGNLAYRIMQDGVTLSRLKSVDGHKNIIKLYSNDAIVIQNLTICQNYKCCFKTEQMPYLERCDCLVYKIEFKNL